MLVGKPRSAARISDASLALLSYRPPNVAASVQLNAVDSWHLRYNKMLTSHSPDCI